MNNIREKIYLAALLHDIGKFYQRADTGNIDSSLHLKPEIKELKTKILPKTNQGEFSHKHCLWTAQFIANYEAVLNNLTTNKTSEECKDTLLFLAASHHLPEQKISTWSKIIKEADSLSSGMDRNSEIAFQDELDEMKSWDGFQKKLMIPILETIGLDEKQIKARADWSHLPSACVSLSKNIFPQKDNCSDPNYKKLWNEFENEFKFIQVDTYKAFSETLLNLLYKYTNCIPTSTINFRDISLYDHSKTTAALALCLYDYEQEVNKPKNAFLLIGADLSGIQDYIYQIVSKFAGKNLKGRSFYLRILSDSIVRYLLKKLNLAQANIIYNSGGGFYLIAPNTTFVKQELEKALLELEHQFFQTHGTGLFMAIDAVELSKDTLLHKDEKNIGTAWEELFKKRDQKKRKKFASTITHHYDEFFCPFMPSNYKGDININKDQYTGEIFSKSEEPRKTDDNKYVKILTHQQIELGKKLRDADFMIISEGSEIPSFKDHKPIKPLNLNFYYYLVKSKEINDIKDALACLGDKISVIRLNGENTKCDFIGATNGSNNIYGFEFYGGNKFNGETFDSFCKKESKDAFKRLGVLRMDVDNLGSIFQKGISPERSTLSRFSALSRSFDYFFSGYLNTIQQETASDDSFIIYSGGDDLFIVADWEKAIELSKRIQSDFAAYTCNNPVFSVSGGIAIVTSKFPIMKGAQLSDNEEKRAKNHICPRDKKLYDKQKIFDKNSISFMEFPMNWNYEFPMIEKLKNNIVKLINDEQIPSSFISKIASHHANAEIKNHRITNLKTFWMATYDLSRLKERCKHCDEAKSLIEECIKEICSPQNRLANETIQTFYHPLELWAFAARWAELEIRSNKKNRINF